MFRYRELLFSIARYKSENVPGCTKAGSDIHAFSI